MVGIHVLVGDANNPKLYPPPPGCRIREPEPNDKICLKHDYKFMFLVLFLKINITHKSFLRCNIMLGFYKYISTISRTKLASTRSQNF
jgi:hypothetical protein